MKDLLIAVCVLDYNYHKQAEKIAAELGASLIHVTFPSEGFIHGDRNVLVSEVVDKILATKADMLLYQVHHTHFGLGIRKAILEKCVGMDLFSVSSGYDQYSYRPSEVGAYLSGSIEAKALEQLEAAKKVVQEAEVYLDNVRKQMSVARQRKEQRMSLSCPS